MNKLLVKSCDRFVSLFNTMMINKILFSIACAALTWILGVYSCLLSSSITILENSGLQSNIVLALAIIPCACLETYLFYDKTFMRPSTLALTFIVVSIVLDSLITVPLFIIPNGGSYSQFFGDPIFYTSVVEFYFIVVYYRSFINRTSRK